VFKFRTENHATTEACLKLMLKERQLRKYKEVYEADLDMIKELIVKCDAVSKYKQLYVSPRSPTAGGGYYFVTQHLNDN
jgi:hypothetical protein